VSPRPADIDTRQPIRPCALAGEVLFCALPGGTEYGLADELKLGDDWEYEGGPRTYDERCKRQQDLRYFLSGIQRPTAIRCAWSASVIVYREPSFCSCASPLRVTTEASDDSRPVGRINWIEIDRRRLFPMTSDVHFSYSRQ
jgi:hypothetical protein